VSFFIVCMWENMSCCSEGVLIRLWPHAFKGIDNAIPCVGLVQVPIQIVRCSSFPNTKVVHGSLWCRGHGDRGQGVVGRGCLLTSNSRCTLQRGGIGGKLLCLFLYECQSMGVEAASVFFQKERSGLVYSEWYLVCCCLCCALCCQHAEYHG
jgi:hypothetical protein